MSGPSFTEALLSMDSKTLFIIGACGLVLVFAGVVLRGSDKTAGKVMKMKVHADGTSCYWIKGQDGIWCMPAPCKHHIKSTEPR